MTGLDYPNAIATLRRLQAMLLVVLELFFSSASQAGAADKDRQKASSVQGGLAKPVPLEVEGKPLVRERGGLFPFVGDLDGDGRQTLLLGTHYEDGRLLVYRNIGTKVSPRLSAPRWFDDTVPTGRIPKG